MIQLSLFDEPGESGEPIIGAWIEEHGAVISHIMRPGYIGSKVVIDQSTQSKAWFRVGILERYFETGGVWRSVVYTGEKQRHLIDHFPGVNIYEVLPWDQYPKRIKSIYKEANDV